MSILTFIAGFCAAVSVGFDLINHCRDQRSTSDKKELTLGYSDIWVEDNPDYNQDVFQKLGIQEPLREILDANMVAEPWIPSRGPLETIPEGPGKRQKTISEQMD